jgi:hypothetical protein
VFDEFPRRDLVVLANPFETGGDVKCLVSHIC